MSGDSCKPVLVQVGLAYVEIISLAITVAMTAMVLKLPRYATPGWFSTVTGDLILVVTQAGAVTLMLLMLMGVLRNKVTQEIFLAEQFYLRQSKIGGARHDL